MKPWFLSHFSPAQLRLLSRFFCLSLWQAEEVGCCLGKVVQSGTDARRAAVVQAETIIHTRVEHFMHSMQARAVVPVIRDLHASADALRAQELDRARRALARGESPDAVLEQLAHGLTQKYLHGPLAALNRSADNERDQLINWVPRLFPSGDTRR